MYFGPYQIGHEMFYTPKCSLGTCKSSFILKSHMKKYKATSSETSVRQKVKPATSFFHVNGGTIEQFLFC